MRTVHTGQGINGNGRNRPSAPRARSWKVPTGPDLLSLALGACILTYVWRVQDLYPILGSVKFPILASLAAIGLYAADKDRRRALRTVKHPITTVILVIMALAVVSVPTSVHDGMSFSFIVDDLSKNFLLMILLAASVRSFADVRRFAAFFLFGAILYAQYVYLYVPVGINGRLGNLYYYDANDLGMLLVCAMPIAIFFLLRAKNPFLRVVAAAALPLFVLVIIKTGSRGAFLGIIAVGVYLLFRFSSIKKGVRITSVAAVAFGLILFGNETYWSMMNTMLHPKEDYNWSGNSESGRMDVWKRGVGYMIRRPITGVGVAAFPIAEGTISDLAARQEFGIGLKWSAAHNSFVQIGAELGIIGLIAYGMLLLRAYRTARTTWPRGTNRARAPDEEVLGHALAGSMVGYAVCGFFLSQAYGAVAFVLYAMIIGLVKGIPTQQMTPARTPRRRGAVRPGIARQPLPNAGAAALTA